MRGSLVQVGDGFPVLPPGVAALAPGEPTRIGPYMLVGRLGAGGMGVVYLGRSEDGGLAAVKVARTGKAGDQEVRERLRTEADSLRRVPASCTARLLTDGTDQTPPYIVTDYVTGRSLKEIVESDGALPPEQVRALATGVARALAEIHRADLVHRDLKPANVLLTPTGPRVIDFGIAHSAPAHGGPTGADALVGSVGWIAPERLTRGPSTAASDIFCWGCLVTYAGTARNPFGTGTAVEVAGRALFAQPDLTGLDEAVRPLVAAALAKSPADRPTAEDLLARLSPTDPLVGPVAAESAPDLTSTNLRTVDLPVSGHRRRRRTPALAWSAAAATVVAATAATALVTAAGGTGASPDPRPALRHAARGQSDADVAVLSRSPAKIPRLDARPPAHPDAHVGAHAGARPSARPGGRPPAELPGHVKHSEHGKQRKAS